MANYADSCVAAIPHKGIAQGFCRTAQKKLAVPPFLNGQTPVLHEL